MATEPTKLTEASYWSPTLKLRWYRPPGGNDNDVRLQQFWRRGLETEWLDVPTELAD